jgi:hydrogenase nickel incorporation protein HypB
VERLPLKSKVLSENQIVAESLRERFRSHGVLCLNLISGPGSGKTALLERTLASFDPAMRVCVLTGDIQTDNDARRLAQYGFPVQQITTGGTCHLDGRMIEKHLAAWDLDEIDLLFIEDCAAERDRGRRQAAQVSIHIFQVGPFHPHQD